MAHTQPAVTWLLDKKLTLLFALSFQFPSAATQFPGHNLTFRNLGWSAETPAGDSRNGLSLLQAGRETKGEGWRQLLKQLPESNPRPAPSSPCG